MRKIQSLIVALTAIMFTAGVAVAAEPAKQKDIETVKIEAVLHCDNCVRKIERAIPFEKGIKDVDVDLAGKTVVVKYDPKKTSEQKVIESLEKIKVEVVSSTIVE